MKFANPALLYALFALAVPVLIHLFNFQRFKKVYFTNVRFLESIRTETQSQSRLKHLLVLAARLLAFAAVILAFAQPFLPAAGDGSIRTERAVSIFIDNSFSMDAENDGMRLLDRAKSKARDIALSYGPTDRFQLLTNDFEGRHQRPVNRGEFLQLAGEVEISPAVKTAAEVTERQRGMLSDMEGRRIAYLLSDFQHGMARDAAAVRDTGIAWYYVPLSREPAFNIYIDSCWFATPVRLKGKPEALVVRVKNVSEDGYTNVPLRLTVNGQQKAIASIDAAANASTELTVSFTAAETGILHGRLSIDDFPITYDDNMYFSWSVADSLAVLCINESSESRALNALFARDYYFRFENVKSSALDYASFGRKNMIVLNGLPSPSSGLVQELKKYVANGGSLLVFPAEKADLPACNALLNELGVPEISGPDSSAAKVAAILTDHYLFRNVFDKIPENMDFPLVTKHYRFARRSRTTEEALLKLQNGDAFLSRFTEDKGEVYLCASPLTTAAGNFPEHSLFVLAIYQAAIHSLPRAGLFHTIGREEALPTPNVPMAGGEEVFRIRSAEGDFEFIPGHKVTGSGAEIYVHNNIRRAGNYVLSAGGTTVRGLSFNYDRAESDPRCYGRDELAERITDAGHGQVTVLDAARPDFAKAVMEAEEGIKLWKLFIILALAFLAAETLLLRMGR